jgi:hypothetical protein
MQLTTLIAQGRQSSIARGSEVDRKVSITDWIWVRNHLIASRIPVTHTGNAKEDFLICSQFTGPDSRAVFTAITIVTT